MTSKPVTASRLDRFRSESGISLIHVAMLLFVFMGFSMFVTDLGALWLARGQAQNAADAGALAGAVARSFDELGPPDIPYGLAYKSALKAASQHWIVGESITAPDITFPPCP